MLFLAENLSFSGYRTRPARLYLFNYPAAHIIYITRPTGPGTQFFIDCNLYIRCPGSLHITIIHCHFIGLNVA